MKTCRIATFVLVGITVSVLAQAQTYTSGGGRGAVGVVSEAGFKVTESAPIEVTPVKGAPFAAQAVTEFTQILEDGNRIDRRYQSSVARDSRGRTRREEEIALIGPFFTAANAGTPRLVTIVDPDSGVTYTLDEEQRVAIRSQATVDKKAFFELEKLADGLKAKASGPLSGGGGRGALEDLKKAEALLQKQKAEKRADAAEAGTVQDLGFKTI